jgi:hypothetical protein
MSRQKSKDTTPVQEKSCRILDSTWENTFQPTACLAFFYRYIRLSTSIIQILRYKVETTTLFDAHTMQSTIAA